MSTESEQGERRGEREGGAERRERVGKRGERGLGRERVGKRGERRGEREGGEVAMWLRENLPQRAVCTVALVSVSLH